MDRIECIVIGGGVIGLATARALAIAGRDVLVLEQESAIGTHTSSRNSEVIHAGIYYPVGSLKSRMCLTGKAMLYEYCEKRDIAHRKLGKLIVATCDEEIENLRNYELRANQNGLTDLSWLDADQVAQLEPEVRCVKALLSPSTGIIDSHEYMSFLQADLEAAGGAVVCNSKVSSATRTNNEFIIQTEGGEGFEIAARYLVNAAGLWAPTMARQVADPSQDARDALLPEAYFAIGHYYTLAGRAPFDRLVYPVASNAGLGVHLTLDLAGQGRFGPDVAWIDGIDYTFSGGREQAFIEAIRRYYPDLDESRLNEGYTGIRPKISGPQAPAADFLIQGPAEHGSSGLVHLFGIESPGLTASLAIADHVVSLLDQS